MIISTYLFTLKNIKLVNWRQSGWKVSISTRRMSKSKEWYAQLLRGTNLTQIACHCKLILQWHIAVNIKMKWSLPSGHIDLFSAATYNAEEKEQSFLIVTNSSDNGKNSVCSFMHKLIDEMAFKDERELIVYSDRPSEFKNQFMMESFCTYFYST